MIRTGQFELDPSHWLGTSHLDINLGEGSTHARDAPKSHSGQVRVTHYVAWPANEHTLLVMHTHPGVCHSPGVTKLAEWGMACVCLMSTLPTFGPTVPESHSEFIRVGFGMGSAWVGHSQVRMSYTGRWESKYE